jgi:16S rRNA (guanine(966)-N(2))-methyltransferase RsmD
VSTVRIIAGEKKGHRLRVAAGGSVRPTGERVREAVFAALASAGALEGGPRVLDLFAGTGAMGLEALSRGAEEAVLVEADPTVAAVLRHNVRTLGYGGRTRILQADFGRALRVLAGRGEAFDLLFVDPPYRMLPDVGRVLSPALPALLVPGGLVVIEGPRAHGVDMGLGIVFERRYGDTVVTMVRKEAESA